MQQLYKIERKGSFIGIITKIVRARVNYNQLAVVARQIERERGGSG